MAAHAPKHLSAHGKKVWHQLVDDYDLDREPHARELLRMALEQLDRAEEVRQRVVKDGAYVTNRHGEVRAHPAIAVEKDAKTLTARLFRELALDPRPPIEDDQRPPRTSLRAVS